MFFHPTTKEVDVIVSTKHIVAVILLVLFSAVLVETTVLLTHSGSDKQHSTYTPHYRKSYHRYAKN